MTTNKTDKTDKTEKTEAEPAAAPLAKIEPAALGLPPSWALPTSLADARELATIIAESDLVPTDYKKKPGNVMVAMMAGATLGLDAFQSVQSIAVVNGRPAVWGDAQLALVRAHPSFEWIRETVEGEADAQFATCTVKRRGEEPRAQTFSMMDAKRAKLTDKANTPWQTYPRRMLQMRARSWALRDAFPDVLKGIAQAEEIRDIPPEDVTVRDATPEEAAGSGVERLKRKVMPTAAEKTEAAAEAAKAEPDPTQPHAMPPGLLTRAEMLGEIEALIMSKANGDAEKAATIRLDVEEAIGKPIADLDGKPLATLLDSMRAKAKGAKK